MNHFEVNLARQMVRALDDGERGAPREYTLAMEYLKERVQGMRFENAVAQLALSPHGFYYQLSDLPASFHGSTRPVGGEFLDDEAARDVMWEAIGAYRSREAQVCAIYRPGYAEDEDALFLGYRPGSPWDAPIQTRELGEDGTLQWLAHLPLERGYFRLELPLFVRIDVTGGVGVAGVREGTLVMLRTEDGENLLVRLPRSALPTTTALKV
ncbi:hypothetical protein HNR42_001759 [Deinobacterium chartae]|uniref:Uncharacterized protein n=1 Tax=Deinobacterium chartae TaxID=521158 RepID=A0A841I052_9DEIO|nr:hypothetical protein [Deinobacterium chartae]MBB6098334.1 hypothetical protein [Deinobacterium chartae]